MILELINEQSPIDTELIQTPRLSDAMHVPTIYCHGCTNGAKLGQEIHTGRRLGCR